MGPGDGRTASCPAHVTSLPLERESCRSGSPSGSTQGAGLCCDVTGHLPAAPQGRVWPLPAPRPPLPAQASWTQGRGLPACAHVSEASAFASQGQVPLRSPGDVSGTPACRIADLPSRDCPLSKKLMLTP